MNEEEARENVKKQLEGIKKANECGLATRGEFNKDIEAIGTVLTLLEKKDKIIDLMIKVMIDSSICDYFIKQNCKHYAGENKKLCDVCIKEYFERKVENGN